VNPNDKNNIVLNYNTTPTAAVALVYDVWLQGPQKGKVNVNDKNQTVLSYTPTGLGISETIPTCP
jgi:hypothetical protein